MLLGEGEDDVVEVLGVLDLELLDEGGDELVVHLLRLLVDGLERLDEVVGGDLLGLHAGLLVGLGVFDVGAVEELGEVERVQGLDDLVDEVPENVIRGGQDEGGLSAAALEGVLMVDDDGNPSCGMLGGGRRGPCASGPPLL